MKEYLSQVFFVFCATSSAISDGMQYGWCSPTVPKLLQEDSPIKVEESQTMWLDSTYMIGGFAGIPFTLIFADKIGRKLCILSASFIFLFVWLITMFGTSIEYFFAARFLAGLAGNMSFVCIPMYIGEVADKRIRGLLGAFLPINVLVGIIIVYCVGPFISITAAACVGICFPIFQLSTFSFMPESPYYLIMKNKIEKAKACLRRLRRTKDIDAEFQEIMQAVRRQQSESVKLKDIYKAKSNRRALAIMLFLHSAQHLGAISVMVMNLHTILQDVSGIISTNTAAIIFSLTMLVSIAISSSLIDKFGRRVLLVTSAATTGVCLLALAIYFSLKDNGTITSCSWIPALCVILYAVCVRIGLGVLPLVVTGEVFSANVKAIGMTLSDVCYIIFGTISLNLFHFLSRSYGLAAPFYLFACYCAFTVVVTILYLPETKASFGSISDGMQHGWCSPTVPKLLSADSPIRIMETDASWLDSIYMIGGIFGQPLTYYLSDNIGRKHSINAACAMFLVSWLLIILGPSVVYFYVARFIGGVGGNISFVCMPMYIAEIAHKNIRGFLGSYVHVMSIIGIIIIYTIAPVLQIHITAAVGICFPIVQLIVFTMMPESPYFLLLTNQEEKARKSLSFLRGFNNIDEELSEIKDAVLRQQSERNHVCALFSVPSNRKGLIITTFLNASRNFGAMTVILMNLHTILAEVHDIFTTYQIGIIFAVVMLVASIVSSSLTDYYGRKILMIISSTLTAVLLFTIAIYFHLDDKNMISGHSWIPAVLVLFYAITFQSGMAVVPGVLNAEMFPTNVKAFGMTLTDLSYTIFGAVSLKFFHALSDYNGFYTPFYLFGFVCIFTAIFTAVYVPETKGKTLEDVQMLLKGKSDKKTLKSRWSLSFLCSICTFKKYSIQ